MLIVKYQPTSVNPGPLCSFALSLHILQARATPVSEGESATIVFILSNVYSVISHHQD